MFDLTFIDEKLPRTAVAVVASSRAAGTLLVPLVSVVRANAEAAVRQPESTGSESELEP